MKPKGGVKTTGTLTDGGDAGGFAISGTFTATGGTQDIEFQEVSNAVRCNAFQVRRLPTAEKGTVFIGR
jgi:hypothetical protein